MEEDLHESIVEKLSQIYNRPLINNVKRGEYVECMIALALGSTCRLVSEDWEWAPWDLEINRETLIEIKQSAALQPWSVNADAPRLKPPKFDIAPRKEPWTKGGGRPYYTPGRPSHIYVFAWHPEIDPCIADHRRPDQWNFFVVPTHCLPSDQKTISLRPLRGLAPEISYADLPGAISDIMMELSRYGQIGGFHE